MQSTKWTGLTVNPSKISGVAGMKDCREWIGCSTIEHGDSIEKVFQLNDTEFDGGQIVLFCRML
jgi:hypothetical protein